MLFRRWEDTAMNKAIRKQIIFEQNHKTLVSTSKKIENSINEYLLKPLHVNNFSNFDSIPFSKLIDDIGTEAEKLAESSIKLLGKLDEHIEKFKDEVGFFDWFLFGLLGDHDKALYLRDLEKLAHKYTEQHIKIEELSKESIKKSVVEKEEKVIRTHLVISNEEYAAKYEALQKTKNIITKMSGLVTYGKSTISDIGSSEGFEVTDMATNNKALGIISTVSTSSTNDAIKKFQREVKKFHELYHADLATLNTFDFAEDMLELNIGLDLMFGFMQLSSLGDAKKQIKEIVEELEKEIDALLSTQISLEKEMLEAVLSLSHTRKKQ